MASQWYFVQTTFVVSSIDKIVIIIIIQILSYLMLVRNFVLRVQ